MSTAKTQTDKTQRPVSVKEFIENYYIKDLEGLINNHPFTAFLVISCGIEFLGKCLSSNDWFDRGHSTDDFNNALKVFDSLNKYSSLGLEFNKNDGEDISLYSRIRCGIVHSSVPKIGLSITEGKNNLPNEIGLKDLSKDFINACKSLLDKKVQMYCSKSLEDIICYIS